MFLRWRWKQETLHRRCLAARVLKHLVCLHSSVHLSFAKRKLRVLDEFRQSDHRLAHPSVQRFAQQLMDTKKNNNNNNCLDAFHHLAGFSPPLYVHQKNICNLIRLCCSESVWWTQTDGRASDRQIYNMFCSRTQSSVVPVLSSSLQENAIK